MPDEQPRPPFIDRAWWQAVTSNAVGTLVGGWLVLLVGVVVGIFATPGGWRRVAIALLLGGIALALGVGGVRALLGAISESGSGRRWSVVLGLGLLLVAAVVFGYMIFFQYNADFTFCDRHPEQCGADG